VLLQLHYNCLNIVAGLICALLCFRHSVYWAIHALVCLWCPVWLCTRDVIMSILSWSVMLHIWYSVGAHCDLWQLRQRVASHFSKEPIVSSFMWYDCQLLPLWLKVSWKETPLEGKIRYPTEHPAYWFYNFTCYSLRSFIGPLIAISSSIQVCFVAILQILQLNAFSSEW